MSLSRWRAVVASALVPAAVVFAIPGLTEDWYVKKGTFSKTKRDPALLLVGQSIGLAFNLFAAVLLILRLGGLETFTLTLACMFCLCIADILDLLCLAIFGASHPNSLKDGFTLSTAYYITLASAICTACSIAVLMVDLVKARRNGTDVHNLTPKQRNLAMSAFFFMAYLAVGGITFKYILGLSFLDSMYFVLSTILTVGYGDITPYNLSSKIVSFFIFPVGIVLIGVIISLIRETVLTSLESRLRKRLEEEMNKRRDDSGRTMNPRSFKKELILPPSEITTYEQVLREAARKESNYRFEIIVSFVMFLVFWIVGALVYMRLENWSFFIAFYFTFMTYSVIGYGEYYPKSPAGRAFYMGWGVTGIIILMILFTLISEAWTASLSDILRSRLRRHQAGRHDSQPQEGAVLDASSQQEGSPSARPRIDPEKRAASRASVKTDLRVLEADVVDRASVSRIEADFQMLLQDCETFLQALVEGDSEAMRSNLSRVISGRDGHEDEDHARMLLLQDDDASIRGMLLKHTHNQVIELKDRMQRRREINHHSPVSPSLSPSRTRTC